MSLDDGRAASEAVTGSARCDRGAASRRMMADKELMRPGH